MNSDLLYSFALHKFVLSFRCEIARFFVVLPELPKLPNGKQDAQRVADGFLHMSPLIFVLFSMKTSELY